MSWRSGERFSFKNVTGEDVSLPLTYLSCDICGYTLFGWVETHAEYQKLAASKEGWSAVDGQDRCNRKECVPR